MGVRTTAVVIGGVALAASALVGCSFHPASAVDDGGVSGDGPAVFDDAGHELRRIVFDSAANWNDAAAVLTDTSVEPWGSITQAGYRYGDLLAHGTASMLWNPADSDDKMTWEPVATAQVAGIGSWDGDDIGSNDEVDQFGIANSAAPFSVYFDGEIFLQQGSNAISLDADQVGFIEIAHPRSNIYTRAVISRGAKESAVYDTQGDVAGWYPFHLGWTRTTGSYGVKLQLAGRDIIRTDLRLRGDSVRGLLRTVFDHEMLADDDPITGLDANDAINAQFLATPPPGAPNGNTEWSAHWAGQLYIAKAGDYTFELDSDDGNELQIGTPTGVVSGISHWGFGDPAALAQTTLSPTTLAIGWHDLVADYNQIGGATFATLKVTAGPDLVGGQIPAAQLRAVEPRGNRLTSDADKSTHTVRDHNASGGTPGVSTATFVGDGSEAPNRLEIFTRVTTAHLDQLSFVLKNPAGQMTTLTPPAGLPVSGDINVTFAVTDPTALGTAVGGVWTLTVQDNVDNGGDSTIQSTYFTMHTANGLDSIARSSVWQWTGDLKTSLASIDNVDWSERVAPTSDPAIIQMRSCDQDNCADNPDFSAPLVHGQPPTLPVKRYIQIKVTLSSDGIHDSELQSLTVNLRRNVN